MTQSQTSNPKSSNPETLDLIDNITVFQLDGTSVRGRSVLMGNLLNEALKTHTGEERYPEPIARLLGEAMMIGAIVAQALKFKGRLVVQCHGTNEGAISLLMADCTTDGHVRGYARWDKTQLKMLQLDNRNPGAKTLLGGGTFSMTIDQGPDMDQYQGLSAIEGASLSDCAEHYFRQSEQIPTALRLACGQIQVPGKAPIWRGAGMMIQRVGADTARGDTEDMWTMAKSLFETVTDAELIDPALPQNDLLYRLFNETGVRIIAKEAIDAQCACSEKRLRQTLESFDTNALNDMADDGIITANCEFCTTDYVFKISELLEAKS